MKILIGLVIAGLLAATSTRSFAASGIPIGSGPGGVPFGAGTQRGLAGLNNSGQNGFVTLFDRGHRSAVVVAIEGSGHRTERVEFHRGASCDHIGHSVLRLVDLTNGFSRGYAPMTLSQLMSGNYITVVYSSTARSAHPVACGELYH